MSERQNIAIVIGVVAGLAIGATQLNTRGFDFAQSADVSQAIGFLLGFAGFGAFIGWISTRQK